MNRRPVRIKGTLYTPKTTAQYKKLRMVRMWRHQNGKCHYCQQPMLHWDDLRSDPGKREAAGISVNKDGIERMENPPPRLATLEHLKDRWDPERNHQPRPGEYRWALACWECNNKRGQERTAEQDRALLRARSQMMPRRYRGNVTVRTTGETPTLSKFAEALAPLVLKKPDVDAP